MHLVFIHVLSPLDELTLRSCDTFFTSYPQNLSMAPGKQELLFVRSSIHFNLRIEIFISPPVISSSLQVNQSSWYLYPGMMLNYHHTTGCDLTTTSKKTSKVSIFKESNCTVLGSQFKITYPSGTIKWCSCCEKSGGSSESET